MKATIGPGGATLHRQEGDPRLYKESTCAFHLRNLLNSQGYHFKRYNPSRENMTDCKIGLIDRKARIILWHEAYQVELAHEAFNNGALTLLRVNIPH